MTDQSHFKKQYFINNANHTGRELLSKSCLGEKLFADQVSKFSVIFYQTKEEF